MGPKILVVRFGSLGDIVLTSATVLNLKIAYPDSHLVYLTKARFAPIVRLMTGVDEILTLPERPDSANLYSFLLRLDARHFDIVVDLHGNPRSWLTRTLVSSGQTAVYPKRRLDRWLLAHQKHKTIPESWPHTIDLYNTVLGSLGHPAYCSRPIFHRWRLPALDDGLRMPDGDYIVVAPGAAHTTKQWPLERFAEVARDLHENHGVSIVWAVTGADAHKSGLERVLPAASFVQFVNYPIERLATILASARLTLSNDSGLMHISSAVGTPVLAVFGPTHPALGFAPRGLLDRVVDVDEPCRPCSLHGKAPCYRTEQFCFTRITPQMIAQAASELLNRKLSKAVLVDRDGTIIVDKHYASDPAQVELVPGAAHALREAKHHGFSLVMLSNQSGVARGYFDLAALQAVQNRTLELLAGEGVTIDAVEYCPHHPAGVVPELSAPCNCRKPFPGMAEKAALQLGLNLHRSVTIGDKCDDLILGLVTGAKSSLVSTGHGVATEQSIRGRLLFNGIGVYESLLDAVQHIITV